MVIKNSEEAYHVTVMGGEKRALQTFRQTLLLSFLGGCYIAIGGFFALRVTGDLPAAVWGSFSKLLFGALFPVGLMLILLTGAELFTGNCMTLFSAFLEKKISVGDVLRNWVLSWAGNFVGTVFFAWFLAYASGLIFETNIVAESVKMPWAEKIVGMANAKTSTSFSEVFLRGILANWLVCLAVYIAGVSSTLAGKVIGLWIPVTAFVAIGAEHCIANMFFVPLGLFVGSDPVYMSTNATTLLTATWQSFTIGNLLPATLGNIAGGAFFVSYFYCRAYKKILNKT